MRKNSLVLLLVLVALTACGSSRRRKNRRDTDYTPGTESHKIEGVIQVEVFEIRVRKHRIHVKLGFENLGDKELRFDRGNVRLAYGDATVPAMENFVGERNIDLLPGQTKRKTYFFEVERKGTQVLAGDYDLVFSGFYTLEPGGKKTLIDQNLAFKLKVP